MFGQSDKESQQMVGFFKFEKLDEIKQEAELGYFLKKDYWGRGLMTECVNGILFLSFGEFDLKRLSIVLIRENLASQRVAPKRAGFPKCVDNLKEVTAIHAGERLYRISL